VPRSLARCSPLHFAKRRRHREAVVALTSHAAALPRMLLPSIIVPTYVSQRSRLRRCASGVLVRTLNVRLQARQRKRGSP
jgi:hypothetical protein